MGHVHVLSVENNEGPFLSENQPLSRNLLVRIYQILKFEDHLF